ncbi:hypothetical protein, partial [Streptomyces sp. NRRL F-2664]|uniref:hypothetical protein n=1 Tax=Streptomyces sp. NRRL F-2664 TaxID=1463842 RepID=UPI00131CA90E
PETGRFTTRDPHPTPLNKYQAYAANPIEHTDPTGNLPFRFGSRKKTAVASGRKQASKLQMERMYADSGLRENGGRPFLPSRDRFDKGMRDAISASIALSKTEEARGAVREFVEAEAAAARLAQIAEDRDHLREKLAWLAEPAFDVYYNTQIAHLYEGGRMMAHLREVLYGRVDSAGGSLKAFEAELRQITSKFWADAQSSPLDPIYQKGSPERRLLFLLHDVKNSWIAGKLRGQVYSSPYRLQ